MKKIVLFSLIFVLLTAGIAMAQTPQFFTFSVGGMYGYDFATNADRPVTPFGAQFQMNDKFSAGFSFEATSNMRLLNVAVSPLEKTYISVYSGQWAGAVAFGAGLGYDFLVNKNAMFSSMGIYMDWLANNRAPGLLGSVEDGGTFMIGLKAKFGI